jgi:hypothetical protein
VGLAEKINLIISNFFKQFLLGYKNKSWRSMLNLRQHHAGSKCFRKKPPLGFGKEA